MRRTLLLRSILAKAPGRAAGYKTVIHIFMVDDQEETPADLRRHLGFIALPEPPQITSRPLAAVPREATATAEKVATCQQVATYRKVATS